MFDTHTIARAPRVALLLTTVAACGGGATGPSTGSTDATDSGPPPIDWTILLVDDAGTGVADAEVCLVGSDVCASASPYVLQVPPGADVAVTIDQADLFPFLIPFTTGAEAETRLHTVLSAAVVEAQAAAAGVTLDPAKGHIFQNLVYEGATAALVGGGGDGPYYLSGGVLDPALTGASAENGAVFLIANVAPGDVELEYRDGMGADGCVPDALNWTDGVTVRAPIVAGRITSPHRVECGTAP